MHDVLYDEDMRCNKCIQNIIYEGFTKYNYNIVKKSCYNNIDTNSIF